VTGALGRGARAAARFVWDFLVGDTPEVLVVVLVIVGAAYALGGHGAVGVVLLPLLAVAGLGFSVWRGYRAQR